MTDELPPLPEPNQECRYLCATCGFYGASGSASHPNDEGAHCGHFPQVLGPWFTAEQMHDYARSARATLLGVPFLAAPFSPKKVWTQADVRACFTAARHLACDAALATQEQAAPTGKPDEAERDKAALQAHKGETECSRP